MLTLLQVLLSEVAAPHRVAVLLDAVDEVLAGHAGHAVLPVLQVSIIDKIPILYAPPHWCICANAGQKAFASGYSKKD